MANPIAKTDGRTKMTCPIPLISCFNAFAAEGICVGDGTGLVVAARAVAVAAVADAGEVVERELGALVEVSCWLDDSCSTELDELAAEEDADRLGVGVEDVLPVLVVDAGTDVLALPVGGAQVGSAVGSDVTKDPYHCGSSFKQ